MSPPLNDIATELESQCHSSSHPNHDSKSNAITKAREKANEIIWNLEEENRIHGISDEDIQNSRNNENNDEPMYYQSWVQGNINLKEIRPNSIPNAQPPNPSCQFFDRNGFLLIPTFASPTEEVHSMKQYMEFLVHEYWHPNDQEGDSHQTVVFRTDDEQINAQASSDYFLDSAWNIHFFAEQDAVHPDGTLKEEFRYNKMMALNKSGHALHLPTSVGPSSSSTTSTTSTTTTTTTSSTSSTTTTTTENDKNNRNPFYTYVKSNKIYNLVQSLGWKNPSVPQSMYIFKQPGIGGTVTSHQDSTFLYTTPKQTCLGLWLALDDATLTNGCLWVRPKSHYESIRRKFIRNSNYFDLGDTTQSQMIFEDLRNNETETDTQTNTDVTWEGSLPGGGKEDDFESSIHHLFNAGFIPIECKAGDLLVFNGALDHLSLANTSDKQRHTFQLHLIEGETEGVKWADSNWLQYTKGRKFMALKD